MFHAIRALLTAGSSAFRKRKKRVACFGGTKVFEKNARIWHTDTQHFLFSVFFY
jgi:hypothetical protein